MDLKQFRDLLKRRREKVEKEIRHVYPTKVGVLAKNHFTQNFRLSGYRDGGTLLPWKQAKRFGVAKGAEGKYPPLLSRRNHLMRSIRYEAYDGYVKIINDVPYAKIHNEGGTIIVRPHVTPKMKKFAWAMFYKALGRRRSKKIPKDEKIPEEAKKWRRLALTTSTRLNITVRIPKRQFIGKSSDLESEIIKKIDEMIRKTLNE